MVTQPKFRKLDKEYNRHRSWEEKSKHDDELTTIVQMNAGHNSRGYTKRTLMISLPKSICQLFKIRAGDLIKWHLNEGEYNSFRMSVVHVNQEDSV